MLLGGVCLSNHPRNAGTARLAKRQVIQITTGSGLSDSPTILMRSSLTTYSVVNRLRLVTTFRSFWRAHCARTRMSQGAIVKAYTLPMLPGSLAAIRAVCARELAASADFICAQAPSIVASNLSSGMRRELLSSVSNSIVTAKPETPVAIMAFVALSISAIAISSS